MDEESTGIVSDDALMQMLANAWEEGRNSLVSDLRGPIDPETGMRKSSRNPYLPPSEQ